MDKCEYCGKEYDIEEYDDCNIRNIMTENQICFYCAFWLEKFQLRDINTFIIGGVHYQGHKIDKSTTKGFIGFGGRDFYIQFSDGRKEYYNNVWRQGDVPKECNLATLFDDNAKFITKEEYETIGRFKSSYDDPLENSDFD